MTLPNLLRSRVLTLCVMLLSLISLYACSRVLIYEEAAAPVAPQQTVHFQHDVRPIFDNKCVACHACNDAPCQLKLSSGEGLVRGASKLPVYDGVREKDQAPSRLGVDASSVSEWRAKGFFSTRFGSADDAARYAADDTHLSAPQSASLMYRMIELGHRNRWPDHARLTADIELGRDRSNECPTLDEFDSYAKKRPMQGMPWGMAGLTDAEFRTLSTWVDEGSVVEPSTLKASDAELAAVAKWEHYLNRAGAREQLVARYLYEHLFLAHLYFDSEKRPRFFEVIRSRTPSPQKPVPLATVRPNEDPGGAFFYRLQLIDETIVEKTHITYALGDKRMKRFDALFFDETWNAGVAPGYAEADRANAFATFAAIPARARYQFMLDNAEYFVRTFIRGPVCSGQIATDVIRDQFWVAFENPETERYVSDAEYRAKATPLIGVPGQESQLLEAGPQWEAYREQRNQYIALRQAEYAKSEPAGPDFSKLWDGDGWNRDALLTIFRHHDSAAVERGLHGALPETLWVMDYPLLERSYYQLVVNFNVFGSVSHQLQTRLYFDLIRNEGEYNFLRFLPQKEREKLRSAWYADSGKLKLFTTYANADDSVPTQIVFETADPKAEFARKLGEKMANIMGPADVLNRCEREPCTIAGETAAQRTANRALRKLTTGPASQLPFIKEMSELTFLRVTAPKGERLVYSLVRNRAHSNVAFLLGEEFRREPDKDTLSVMPGVYGSYPNFIFDVPLDQIDSFTSQLAAADKPLALTAVVDTWGVRRTHPDFWSVFHDFTQYVEQTRPIEAGMFDLNRYGNL